MKIAVMGMGALGARLADAVKSDSRNELLARDKDKRALKGIKNSSVKDLLEAECLFICVNDDAVDGALKEVKDFRNHIVLLSASAEIDDVKRTAKNARSISIFHPMQSFPAGSRIKSEFRDFYATLECTGQNRFLSDLARKRNIRVIKLKRGTNRKLYHLSAMMAGNYTSLLLIVAERILRESALNTKIDGRVFVPMIKKIIERLEAGERSEILSGPSARGDSGRIREIAAEIKDDELRRLFLSLDRMAQRGAKYE